MGEQRLSKRGGRYYFRMRIPTDLKLYFPQRREIRVSLNTDNRAIAKRLVAEKSAELLKEIEGVRNLGVAHVPRAALMSGELPLERLRRANRFNSVDLIEVHTIDDAFITRVCMTYLRGSLLGDADHRANPDFGGAAYVELHAENRKANLRTCREMLRMGEVNEEPIREELSNFLAQNEFKISGERPGYRLLLMRFLEVKIRALEALDSRDAGNVVDIDGIAPLEKTFMAQEDKPHMTMAMIFDIWNRAQVRRPKTVAEYKTVAGVFEVFVRQNFKVREVAHVTKAHIVAFRDHLTDDGQSYKTVLKKVGIVKSIFSRAASDDVLKSNPGDRVKVTAPRVAAKPRVSFTAEDLKAIFSSNIYQSSHELAGCGRASLFWLPLIALFTGMRLEEICQLRVRDVRQDPELGWFISINDEDGKQVKTHSSRRNVPIHPELRRIGFLAFVRSVRVQSGLLFAELATDKYGRRGSRFSKQWNKHLRISVLRLKDSDRSRSFHSFRHTFKEICRRVGMSEEIHDGLTGHRCGATEGRKYGSGMYPLPPLFRAMPKYQVHELKLSHLRWSIPGVKRAA